MNAAPSLAFIPEIDYYDYDIVTIPSPPTHRASRSTPPPRRSHTRQHTKNTPVRWLYKPGVRLLVSASVGCCGSHGEIF